jgi:hypothetical protein
VALVEKGEIFSMSVSKRKYEEMLEEQSDKELASILGISYDELCQLEWDVDTNESSDGLIYDYIYTFRDDSNLEILKKIQGIIIIRFKFPRLKVNISSLYINPLYFFQYL